MGDDQFGFKCSTRTSFSPKMLLPIERYILYRPWSNAVKESVRNQNARIRIENVPSNKAEILRGVRQGCVLSQMLMFDLYSEILFGKARDWTSIKMRINGVNINSNRYTNDALLIADSDVGFQNIIGRVNGLPGV